MKIQSRRFILAIITLFTLCITIASLGTSKADPAASLPCSQAPTFQPRVPTNTPSGTGGVTASQPTTAPCQTPTPIPPTPVTPSKSYSSLIAKASQTGKVRVIVGLNMPVQLEGVLSQLQITTQRLQVQNAKTILTNMLAPFGIKKIATDWQIPFMAMEVSPTALQYMRNLPQIKSIEEDRRVKVMDTDSTTLISAPQAWALGYDGTGYSVAILDTGVQNDHPFLAGKVVAEACYSTTDATQSSTSACPGGAASATGTGAAAPCLPTIGCDHGTHVAGLAAGLGGGSTGVSYSGVAKGANIVAVQVFSKITGTACDPDPTCALAFNSDILSGLNYAYNNRSTYNIASVNMSLGGGFYSDAAGQPYCDAASPSMKSIIDQLRSVGIPTVIASGNDGFINGIAWPGCISSAVAVGAVETAADTNGISNIAVFSNSSYMVDLLAPGDGFTPYWGIESSVPGSSYDFMAGTSMAAPHVAGAWAVLKQKYPTASFYEILETLQDTAVGITDSWNSVRKPRIKLDDAVTSSCDNSLPHLIKGITGYQSYGGNGDRISGDGRYVIFESNLLTQDGLSGRKLVFDGNNMTDIIFHDRLTCQTMRVSISFANYQPNGNSVAPSISSDGRYIAYTTGATNVLVPNGSNSGPSQIYVFDRTTMQNSPVSVSSTGVFGTNLSVNPSISADGRYVAFESDANNLVAGTNVVHRDIFLRDRTTNTTTLVTHVGAVYSNGWSGNAAISSNGNFIAFQSQATSFAANDTNGSMNDIFLYDRTMGTITMVSRSITGGSGNGQSINPTVSSDGHFVVFESTASNLVYGDTNGKSDIFIRDVWGGVTFPVSVANYTNNTWSDNNSTRPSMSANGDYVMFESDATNLVSGDTNGKRDIFIRKVSTGQTIRVSLSSSNGQLTADSMQGFIAPSTNNFVYRSSASNVVASGDTNNADDFFVNSFSFPATPTRVPTKTRTPAPTSIPPMILTTTPTPTYTPSPTPTITPTPTNSYSTIYGPLPMP